MAHKDPLTRFASRWELRDGSDCWWWTAGVGSHGYGSFHADGSPVLAHRWSYVHHHGLIPPDMDVRHSCDNRRCVNPAHLSLGSRKQNMEDAVARGRIARGERSGLAVLTDEVVRQIRSMTGSNQAIANQFRVSRETIRRVRRGTHWTHVEGGQQ